LGIFCRDLDGVDDEQRPLANSPPVFTPIVARTVSASFLPCCSASDDQRDRAPRAATTVTLKDRRRFRRA
jgi:hypothetical protein